MAQNVTLWGATYSNVPAILVPKSGGGTARFTDLTPTTAVESDVASGKIFFLSDGTQKTGTASGGSSLNWQISNSGGRIASSSYTDTGISLTVAQTGTYNVYWSAFRTATSGTNGTQLHIGSNTYGSAQTSWTSTYYQAIKLTGVSLTKNQVLKVYARSRGNSYYVCVVNLVIEQTA